MSFLYKSDPVRGAAWAELFARNMPELPFRIWPDIGDPRQVRYLAAWQPPEDLATRFPNLEVLFSTGAGTDHFDFSVIPEALPVVRMVEPGIIKGMVEYVALAVLSIHRDWRTYLDQQREGNWRVHRVHPAAAAVRPSVLGASSCRNCSGADPFNVGLPIGKTTRDIDANEVIWKFFEKHRR